MFHILLNDKKEENKLDIDFIRIWRLATRKLRETQLDDNKGVIFNIVTPDAFNLKPAHRSVSLNRLEIETDNEDEDSRNNRKVMACKVSNSLDENVASIFIGAEDFLQAKLSEDPEYAELLNFFKIERTPGGSFSYGGINACHYDLIYLSKLGRELLSGDEEFKEDYIINTKRLISELAKLPQSSLIP
ncbi:hypothetical protein [Pantoea sp. EEL5]|uniref:hypothetical protein n=1 Tax=Pantoea sp. EEL5 TaxID=3416806 RepID=UPI003CEEE643